MMMTIKKPTVFNRHRGICNVQTASILISLYSFTTVSQDDRRGTSAGLDGVRCHEQTDHTSCHAQPHSTQLTVYDPARPCNKPRLICDRRPRICACTIMYSGQTTSRLRLPARYAVLAAFFGLDLLTLTFKPFHFYCSLSLLRKINILSNRKFVWLPLSYSNAVARYKIMLPS